MFEDVNVWFLRAVEGTANVSIKLDIPSPVSCGSTKKLLVLIRVRREPNLILW
jgi:hypothetical protein